MNRQEDWFDEEEQGIVPEKFDEMVKKPFDELEEDENLQTVDETDRGEE